MYIYLCCDLSIIFYDYILWCLKTKLPLICLTMLQSENKNQDHSYFKLLKNDAVNKIFSISPRKMFITEANKCKARFSTVIALIFIGFILLSVISISLNPTHRVVHILYIQGNERSEYITNKKYLSLGLDSSIIADGFRNFDMRSIKLRNMLRNLSPGYLRIGGTMADRLRFTTNNSHSLKVYASEQDGSDCAYEGKQCSPNVRPNFTLSANEWLELYDLAISTGFTILFDLNALTRHKDGSWNYKNAEELIKFSNDNKMDVIWQLGNEPNSFHHVFNYTVNATQLAKDFVTLRNILNKYPLYRGAALVGPEVTRPKPEDTSSFKYLKEFLDSGGGHVLDAVTYHQYYFNGRTATSEDFLNVDIFNLMRAQTDLVKGLVTYYDGAAKPVWLTETACAYGGGAPGFSNRYIGTFIWLDKLGLAAKLGVDVLIRQSLFKGYYALIDNNYDPTPDYWISAIYKAFVGPEVVPCVKASSENVRLYCQCTNKNFKTSAVTLYGINLKDTEALIRVEGLRDPKHALDTIYAYILSPYLTLFTRNVYLNKELLVLGPNGELPPFRPKLITDDVHVAIPPYSSAFFVIPTDVAACH